MICAKRFASNNLRQTFCVKHFASNILLITDNSYTMRKAPNDLRQTICVKQLESNDLRHAPEQNPGPALESKFGSGKAGIFVDQRKKLLFRNFFSASASFFANFVRLKQFFSSSWPKVFGQI